MKLLLIYCFTSLCLSLACLSCRDIIFANGYHKYAMLSGLCTDTTAIHHSTAQEFTIYDIHPHDTIADIGYHYGSIEGAMLLDYDSLCIFAEDYNTPARSEQVIYRTFEQYAAMRTSPNTNTIKILRGGDKTTGLPGSAFDKVIVRKTLHHIQYRDEMLDDIHSILKPDGRLYIMEPTADTTYYDPFCQAYILGHLIIIDLLTKHGFTLLSETILYNNKNDAAPWTDNMVQIPFTISVFKKESRK